MFTAAIVILFILSVFLQIQISSLTGKNIDLKAQVESLTLEKDRLQSQVSNLMDQNIALRGQVADLINERTALQTRVTDLQSRVSNLIEENTNLQSQLRTLTTEYLSYKSSHSHTDSEYDKLNTDYLKITSYYRSLSENVKKLHKLLTSYSYSSIPRAFTHTLNNAEVQKVSSAVRSASVSQTDTWYSLQKIYEYIVSNIKYRKDVEITYQYIELDGFNYVTNFTITMDVQTPELTLNIKQGDYDDIAVLTYAMIKYYMKYINGTEYLLYIAYIIFSDNSKHLAVFVPVKGGGLCIIDPAGNYLTSWRGSITSEEAPSELQNYSKHWSEHGSITYMELYRVSIVDGRYELAVEGSLDEVATFLSQQLEQT